MTSPWSLRSGGQNLHILTILHANSYWLFKAYIMQQTFRYPLESWVNVIFSWYYCVSCEKGYFGALKSPFWSKSAQICKIAEKMKQKRCQTSINDILMIFQEILGQLSPNYGRNIKDVAKKGRKFPFWDPKMPENVKNLL